MKTVGEIVDTQIANTKSWLQKHAVATYLPQNCIDTHCQLTNNQDNILGALKWV